MPEAVTHHGVLLEVFNLGLLLTGQSGIGKSEIALGLISRGHRLIADDAVMFSVSGRDIVGSCPPRLQNFLEVRGLGVLNIEKIYGAGAVKKSCPLNLIAHLTELNADTIRDSNRLRGIHDHEIILGLAIPRVVIPVGPGRNLAVIIEAAVRNQKLKLEQGYDSAEDFCSR